MVHHHGLAYRGAAPRMADAQPGLSALPGVHQFRGRLPAPVLDRLRLHPGLCADRTLSGGDRFTAHVAGGPGNADATRLAQTLAKLGARQRGLALATARAVAPVRSLLLAGGARSPSCPPGAGLSRNGRPAMAGRLGGCGQTVAGTRECLCQFHFPAPGCGLCWEPRLVHSQRHPPVGWAFSSF